MCVRGLEAASCEEAGNGEAGNGTPGPVCGRRCGDGRALPAGWGWGESSVGRSVCVGPPGGDPVLGGGDPPREGFISCGLFSIVCELKNVQREGETLGTAGGPGVGKTKELGIHDEDIPGALSTFCISSFAWP